MGCATGIVKYFVFLANLIFALAGLALVIIGVLYQLKVSDAVNVLPKDFGLAPILSIIIGSIVFVTAFLGCCGAVKESPCMLTTYAIILLTIFILQVAIGVYAFLQIKDENAFKTSLRTSIEKTFSRYDHSQENKETVDVTQQLLQCCGVDGPSSWQLPSGDLPPSCCGLTATEQSQTFNRRCSPAQTKYHRGCVEALYETLQNSSQIIGGVAIGIAAIEIIGAVFGLCLASSIRNHYRRNIYA